MSSELINTFMQEIHNKPNIMKHLYSGLFLIGTCISLLSSCSGEENPWTATGDEGRIRLTVASDGEVFRSTRADDTKATIIPTSDELNITLSRTDGSSSQKWANMEAFNKETTFPIGEYKIEASYGNKDTEGLRPRNIIEPKKKILPLGVRRM